MQCEIKIDFLKGNLFESLSIILQSMDMDMGAETKAISKKL